MIVTVLKSGGDFQECHVERLKKMCDIHLPGEKFVCLTDVNLTCCETIQLTNSWRGWWSKIEAFKIQADNGILYMDLDTVLVSDCSRILDSMRLYHFCILRDVYRGKRNPMAMQSSVMFWRRDLSPLLRLFCYEKDILQFRGDQDFIEWGCAELGITPTFIQDISQDVAFFKSDVASRGFAGNQSMIIFHGAPRPWEQDIVPSDGRFKLQSGWWVPTSDEKCLGAVLKEVVGIDKSYPFCKGFRTVIQAGGNIGIWPSAFAKRFDRVLAFEPDSDNFEAMSYNTRDVANIEKYEFGLGDSECEVFLKRESNNVGAHHISSSGTTVRIRTIDSLNISNCDLIQLDIEGYEHKALLGARKTIESSKPAIHIELKGLGKRYGSPDDATISFLKEFGYSVKARWMRDVILAAD